MEQREQEEREEFIDAMQTLLDKQAEYGVELANNDDFLLWFFGELCPMFDYPEDGYEDFTCNPNEDPVVRLTDNVKSLLGDPYDVDLQPVSNIRTIDQMSAAFEALDDNIDKLGWWSGILNRRRQLWGSRQNDPKYTSCSDITKELVDIYWYDVDETTFTGPSYEVPYYIYQSIDWMDEQYGQS